MSKANEPLQMSQTTMNADSSSSVRWLWEWLVDEVQFNVGVLFQMDILNWELWYFADFIA